VNDIAYTIPPGGAFDQTVDLTLHGDISSRGRYRIMKLFGDVTDDTRERYDENRLRIWAFFEFGEIPRSQPMQRVIGADFSAELRQDTYLRGGSAFSDSTEVHVTLANGKTLSKTYEGWYFLDSHLLRADLTGDGTDEIIAVLPVGGSNYGATEVHVLSVDGGSLREVLTILDNPSAEKEITYKDSLFVVPQLADYEGLTGHDNYTGFCTGAQVTQTTDGAGLWVQHYVDDATATTLSSVIRWDGAGWVVAGQGVR
jgi:hypothetical protein